jgi:trk system potassium uptake protein TrkA
MVRRLLPEGAEPLWRDATGTIRLAEVHVAEGWIGHALRDLEEAADCRVAFVSRLGAGFVPGEDTVIQEGDLIHVVMRESDTSRVETLFGKGPEER